jgi:hypothetical protein
MGFRPAPHAQCAGLAVWLGRSDADKDAPGPFAVAAIGPCGRAAPDRTGPNHRCRRIRSIPSRQRRHHDRSPRIRPAFFVMSSLDIRPHTSYGRRTDTKIWRRRFNAAERVVVERHIGGHPGHGARMPDGRTRSPALRQSRARIEKAPIVRVRTQPLGPIIVRGPASGGRSQAPERAEGDQGRGKSQRVRHPLLTVPPCAGLWHFSHALQTKKAASESPHYGGRPT